MDMDMEISIIITILPKHSILNDHSEDAEDGSDNATLPSYYASTTVPYVTLPLPLTLPLLLLRLRFKAIESFSKMLAVPLSMPTFNEFE